MRRCFTMVFPLVLGASVLTPGALAQDAVSSAGLEQALAGDVSAFCDSLPRLRSTDLQTALNRLYQHSAQAPLWLEPESRQALGNAIDTLADDGLSPADYALAWQAQPPLTLCEELRISSEYLQALEHLSRGRLVQAEVETVWLANGLPPASVQPLIDLAMTGLRESIVAAFDQARPGLPEYRRLRAAYASMDRLPADRPAVPDGPLLRPGMSDARVPQIAAQLREDGFLPEVEASAWMSDDYDAALQAAIERFQASHGLQVDGVIGPRTLSALNVSPAQRLEQVQISLERLRWINALRSDYLLLINVASNQVQLLRGDELLWQARAQTGRPARPTPALVSRINRVTLNPGWTVPPTIFQEDILPQIRRNPGYLEQHGMQTLDAQGKLLDPEEIDWRNPRGVMLRQPPGPSNPLGQLVFRLPNPFAIFLHDTPSQHLFQQSARHLSSGCVRVEQAETLASHLFAGFTEAQRARIADQLASGDTHEIALPDGPQVILAYWTAYVTADGQLSYAPDSYGLDRALNSAQADADRLGEALEERFLEKRVPEESAQMTQRAEAGCDYHRVPPLSASLSG